MQDQDRTTATEAPHRGSMTLAGTIALLLLAIGGLNWGLVGAADFNLVEWMFGRGSLASRVVYLVVAIAAVYCLVRLPRWSRAG